MEKLSNFFGVQSGDGKGSSSKSKSDIKELTRLLHVMNKKMSVASLTHSMGGQELDSISSTHKERESEKAVI